MKPVLIIPVELYPQLNIANYRFALKVENVDQIQKALEIVKEQNQCMSILCELNDVDVVALLNMDIKSSVNVYINCIFNGDMLSVIKALEPSEKRSRSSFVTYFFPVDTPDLVTLLKVLSSCGYKSGLQFDCVKSINKEDFIELATYSYLSPVPHAHIEPFGFIQQEIGDKSRYVDINKYYFNSPETFVHIEADGEIYLKSEFELKKHLCKTIEELSRINFDDISMEYKKLRFYNHFDAEDRCSKCPNFKICSGVYQNRFEDCQETMSTIYEMLF